MKYWEYKRLITRNVTLRLTLLLKKFRTSAQIKRYVITFSKNVFVLDVLI